MLPQIGIVSIRLLNEALVVGLAVVVRASRKLVAHAIGAFHHGFALRKVCIAGRSEALVQVAIFDAASAQLIVVEFLCASQAI